MKKPIILAFGYEARSGKGECASVIHDVHSLDRGGRYKVLRISFADRLREEVAAALFDRWVQDYPDEGYPIHDPQIAMRHLCDWAGVEYEENPSVDALYPLGKQRKLYQWWGTEYRRSENPDYWVDAAFKRIEEEQPDVVVIDDLRFPNEFERVKAHGGVVCRVIRPNIVPITNGIPGHVSESALANHEFDYYLYNNRTLNDLHDKALSLFDEIVSGKPAICKHCTAEIRETPVKSGRWADALNDADCGLYVRTSHEPIPKEKA